MFFLYFMAARANFRSYLLDNISALRTPQPFFLAFSGVCFKYPLGNLPRGKFASSIVFQIRKNKLAQSQFRRHDITPRFFACLPPAA